MDYAVNRTSGMALFGAANGLGFVLGPAMGAWLAPMGLTAPMYVSAALVIAASMVSVVMLPEGQKASALEKGLALSILDKRVRLYLAVGLVLSTIMIIMQVTSGFYLQDRLSVSIAESTRIIGIGLSIGGFLVVLCQYVITRFFKDNRFFAAHRLASAWPCFPCI